jgi:hypothetical protein
MTWFALTDNYHPDIEHRFPVDKKQAINLIDYTKPDVIFGTETWLDPSIKDAQFFQEGYNIYRNDRNLNGGGVLIAVKDTSFYAYSKFIISSFICSLWVVISGDIDGFVSHNLHLAPNYLAISLEFWYR